MQGEIKKRFEELCTRAGDEQDPSKLIELMAEISKMLAAKMERLAGERNRIPDPTHLP
jgi:hypothetical protein